MDPRPQTLELFAGIGGLSLGLERAGFSVVGQVEIDPWCQRVLAKHWPEVPRHDDVRTALDWWLSRPRPGIDAIVGGYPCQPESLASTGRQGTTDQRWLWPEFARIIDRLRPRYVIGENVMGHRTSGLRFVLRDLERLGYSARAGIVAASEVGAPHRRQRIFILAELADADSETRGSQTRIPKPRSRGTSASFRTVKSGRRSSGADVADADRQPTGRPAISWRQSDQWAAEPDMGRVAYGVPSRVDRLRGLGNAVVPQVAEFVGRLLLSGAWKSDF